jgi:hypothetical protein
MLRIFRAQARRYRVLLGGSWAVTLVVFLAREFVLDTGYDAVRAWGIRVFGWDMDRLAVLWLPIVLPLAVTARVVWRALQQHRHWLSLGYSIDTIEGGMLAFANSAQRFRENTARMHRRKAEARWVADLDALLPFLEEAVQRGKATGIPRTPATRAGVAQVLSGLPKLRQDLENVRLLANLQRFENTLRDARR